jgi:predicted metal-dependent phosphoesterase TrpH
MPESEFYADMHLHTVASDGELTPEELVDRAVEAGLSAIAVTDHDTVGSVEAASAYGKTVGVEIVPGCELTMYEDNIELHLLALFIDIAPDSAFQKFLQQMQQHRRFRALSMIAKLKSANVQIEESDVIEAAGSADSIGRPHIADALVKRGYATSPYDAMNRYLQHGRPGYVPKHRLTPETAFAVIRAAGGLSILAHPGRSPHDELIVPLFHRGMDGIEALYRSHSPVLRKYYSGLARRHERAISGGSDFHGPMLTPDISVGDAGVDRYLFSTLKTEADRRKVGRPMAGRV